MNSKTFSLSKASMKRMSWLIKISLQPRITIILKQIEETHNLNLVPRRKERRSPNEQSKRARKDQTLIKREEWKARGPL